MVTRNGAIAHVCLTVRSYFIFYFLKGFVRFKDRVLRPRLHAAS